MLQYMTKTEERLFMLDLAIVQLIAGILVTLGATMFAISIGFGLTIPAAMQDAISQMLTRTEVSPEVQKMIVQESMTNYVLVLAAVGILLILSGILFASIRTRKIRKQILYNNKISNLLDTDIKDDSKEIRPNQASLPDQSHLKKYELTMKRGDANNSKVQADSKNEMLIE
jgi:hypothetical protein